MTAHRPYTFDRVVRILFTIAIIVALIFLLNILKNVLLPFCIACLIAYIFEPFVQYNRSLLHLRGRIIPIFVTLFEALVLFGILCYFCIPSIIAEMHQMADLVKQYASSTDIDIPYLPDALHKILRNHIDFQNLASTLTEQDVEDIFDGIAGFLSNGVNIILSIFAWLIVFLYVIFILLDYDNLMRGFKLMVPPKYRAMACRVGNDIKRSMNHYFRGQALIALIVAVLYAVGFSIIGLPLSVVLGIMNGVLFMVPYLVYVSIIPVTLLCLVYSMDQNIEFWSIWWGCIAVYAIVQIIADLILTPKIMGKAMGLNPAIILLSLSVWGTLLGFLGMIIALPLTTLLIAYYEEYIINRHDESPGEKRDEVDTINSISKFPLSK